MQNQRLTINYWKRTVGSRLRRPSVRSSSDNGQCETRVPLFSGNGSPEPAPRTTITNFGRNVRFTPRQIFAPRSEGEVLELLDRHARGRIRVVGSRHAWSDAIVSTDVLVDLGHFDQVEVAQTAGETWATVGGGCTIKRLLERIHALSDATIPSLGLVTEQTIAGAISTGTHGSGRHSMSHYIDELRIAAYDAKTGKARIYVVNSGSELAAARCGLGCLGIILAVRFRCIPKYFIAETMQRCGTLDDVLAGEEEYPLQQFFLVPHRWDWFVQRRRPVPAGDGAHRSWHAPTYRLYWYLGIDVGLHLIIKFMTGIVKSRRLVRFSYRWILAQLILRNVTIVDTSDRTLVMEHELFRHLEIELFVPARHLKPAADFVREVLAVFDGSSRSLPAEIESDLQRIGMADELASRRGTFTHHYVIAFRKVLADDTLISMAEGNRAPYYALSFITYVEPRDRFLNLAQFLARALHRLYGARPHWGKNFPLEPEEVAQVYPRLEEFRQVCLKFDPRGVFRNKFVNRALGFEVSTRAMEMSKALS